jgi:hypothetical protein
MQWVETLTLREFGSFEVRTRILVGDPFNVSSLETVERRAKGTERERGKEKGKEQKRKYAKEERE